MLLFKAKRIIVSSLLVHILIAFTSISIVTAEEEATTGGDHCVDVSGDHKVITDGIKRWKPCSWITSQGVCNDMKDVTNCALSCNVCEEEEEEENSTNNGDDDVCEDSTTPFKISSGKRKTCSWAQEKPAKCDTELAVAENCRKSCGKCPPSVVDNPNDCSDSTESFQIESGLWKKCKWALNKPIKCKTETAVAENCPKSCGNCSNNGNNDGNNYGDCKDSTASFQIKNGKWKKCTWASSKQSKCNTEPTVMENCPYTCGSCPSSTTDDDTPTSSPSNIPTISSDRSEDSPSPSDVPSTEPTFIPSSIPTNIPLRFDGVESAFSVQRGLIHMYWDVPTFHDEIPDLESTIYHIFTAVGNFNYQSMLVNTTIDEMIRFFNESESSQYDTVSGEEFQYVVETEYLNQVHSILVIAESDTVRSKNTIPTVIIASDMEPRMKDGVNVIGIFLPTDHLDIYTNSTDGESTITFSGALLPDHQSMVTGDIITGITSNADTFMLQVVNVLILSSSKVVLQTSQPKLEDIFQELEFEYSFPASRPNRTVISSSSARRYGRILRRIKTRRLCFWDFGWVGDGANWFAGVVTDGAKWVGDRFVEGFEALSNLAQGRLDERMRIIDMKASLDAFGGGGAVSLSGDFEVRSDLQVQLRIFEGVSASTSFTVSYGMDIELDLKASIEQKAERDWNIWQGRKNERLFMIGPVPIEISWQPKLDAKADITCSLEANAKFSAGFDGGSSMSAGMSLIPPDMYANYNPPTFNPYYSFDGVEASASLDATVAVILSVDVDFYKGLITTNTGLYLGVSFGTTVETTDVGSEVILALSKFDLNLDFKIPFTVGTVLDDSLSFVDTNFYEQSWPILQLPEGRFRVGDHFCEVGDGSNTATIRDITVSPYSDSWIKSGFRGQADFYFDSEEWDVTRESSTSVSIERQIVDSDSHSAQGDVYVAIKPSIPPFPLPMVYSVDLADVLNTQDEVACLSAGSCSDSFFDTLASDLSSVFDTSVFLSQPPDENADPVPSTIYKFADLMSAVKKLEGTQFEFWLGDNCDEYSRKIALVNIATFLGQAMRETIIYDACDENNWDKWLADVYKEPTSPPEIPAAFYPMTSSCGQLGQKYAEYDCDDACPRSNSMEITATTNAAWIGAPPPLFCGPKSKYDDLGYWNPMMFCQGTDNSCDGEPFSYPGQTAGVHIPSSSDPLYPEFYYSNPQPDSNGSVQPARPLEGMPASNVEGCCWWGRGVIQTTGRCNFGRLNKNIGQAAGSNALYPDINFCENPQAICEGPSELKWIAGLFFWTSEVETYSLPLNPNLPPPPVNFYKSEVMAFIDRGCMDNLEQVDCDNLFKYASGIVNRGCHDPGPSGCPGCIPGATCDPAHKIPERIESSKLALRALMGSSLNGDTSGTCGGGSIGNGICKGSGECCSDFGWCGTSPEYCGSGETGGTCGGGNVGNGICEDPLDCCSSYGWCGRTDDHCK